MEIQIFCRSIITFECPFIKTMDIHIDTVIVDEVTAHRFNYSLFANGGRTAIVPVFHVSVFPDPGCSQLSAFFVSN